MVPTAHLLAFTITAAVLIGDSTWARAASR